MSLGRLFPSTILCLALAAAEIPNPAGAGSGQPFLASTAGGGLYLSWLEPGEGSSRELRYAVKQDHGWSVPRTIARGDNWFVNWADYPSLAVLADGAMVAHWLERGPHSSHSYGLRLAHSADHGASWFVRFSPRPDLQDSYNGFVSLLGVDRGFGAAYLNHRQSGMALQFARFGAGGRLEEDSVLDPDVCTCCPTGAALTDSGPVIVYRDHEPGEIRDISIVRRTAAAWTKPRAVHRDGWRIHACPVNGPAVAAKGRVVAVAWYTAAGDKPRVYVAFSEDSGESFRSPVRVDSDNPAGRVGLLLDGEGAVVSWIEKTGAESAELRVRRAERTGRLGDPVTVAPVSPGRSTGFPRIALWGGRIVAAWTAGRVHTAELPPPP